MPAIIQVAAIPVVETILGTNRPNILRGLEGGEYTRWGGVIRRTKGQPGAGQIVAHLRDHISPDASRVLSSQPVPSLSPGAFEALGETMQQTLQMSSVAAAASVLNLGVSIAGFAYMAYQMHQLKQGINQLERSIEKGFSHMDQRFEQVLIRLEELRWLALSNQQLAREVLEEVVITRDEILNSQCGQLIAALEMNQLGRKTEDNLRQFKQVRHTMEATLDRLQAVLHPRRIAELGSRIRFWALAAGAEAQLLFELGHASQAATVYQQTGQFILSRASEWISEFYEDDQGWACLAHSRLRPQVRQDRLRRLAETAAGDILSIPELTDQVTEAAVRMDGQVQSATDEDRNLWLAAGALTDLAVEVGRRLESKGDELAWALDRGYDPEEWAEMGQEQEAPCLLVPDVEDWL